MNHVVYKISGRNTKQVYYGYTTSEDQITEAYVISEFLKGAQRTFADNSLRNSTKWLNENGNDLELTATMVGNYDNELEAFIYRNEHRADDLYSFCGPSVWPTGVSERANKEHAARVLEIQSRQSSNEEIRKAKTARQGWALGFFTKDQVTALADKFSKAQIVHDLDALNPFAFAQKYDL